MVKQNNSIIIYLDGSEVFNDTYGNMNLTNGNPYFIGKQSENHGNYWDGFIDQMAFWNKALDYSEVLALNGHNGNANKLISGFENYESSESLVALYTFDEGEGSILTDLSGNGNNGIIHGATWSGDSPTPPVYGCTDSYADNYNSDANLDDGSCYFTGDVCSAPFTASAGNNTTTGINEEWFSYTTTMDGHVTVSTVGLTEEDTWMAVLGSCDMNTAGEYTNVLGVNDDYDGTTQSQVTVMAAAGTEIFITFLPYYAESAFYFSITEGETYFQLLRGSTTIGNSSAGNYDSFAGVFGNSARSSYYDLNSQVFNFLDDAQDTNAHVYKVQWANVTNVSTYLNRTAYSTSGAYYSYSGSSSFTLMEVEV